MHTCRRNLSVLRLFLHNFLVVSAIILFIFLFHNFNQQTDGRKNADKRRWYFPWAPILFRKKVNRSYLCIYFACRMYVSTLRLFPQVCISCVSMLRFPLQLYRRPWVLWGMSFKSSGECQSCEALHVNKQAFISVVMIARIFAKRLSSVWKSKINILIEPQSGDKWDLSC